MKTSILIKSASVAIVAVGLMSFGCSKSSSQANNTATVPTTTTAVVDPFTGSTSFAPTFSGGATATFVPTSMDVMNTYIGMSVLNAPSDFQINLNLTQSIVGGRYGGTITISYMDNGQRFSGTFRAGTGKNQYYSSLHDNDKAEAEYNYWFNFENQLVFTGFFQDQWGAITLSLQPETTSTGGGNDGEPILTTTYKGSVSFKNFTNSFATQYQRACWFVYNGPYDCRSNIIQTKCGLTPGSEAGYQVLGTFTGMNVKTAFNISN